MGKLVPTSDWNFPEPYRAHHRYGPSRLRVSKEDWLDVAHLACWYGYWQAFGDHRSREASLIVLLSFKIAK